MQCFSWGYLRLSAAASLLLAGLIASSDALAGEELRISHVQADRMLEQCLEHSKSSGWPPFSLAVVDASGSLILFRRQEGASPATADAALLKARASVRTGVASGELAEASRDPATRDLLLMLQITNNPGGLPLEVNGRLVAAIGVSGGTSLQDVECAKLAVAAFAAPLAGGTR